MREIDDILALHSRLKADGEVAALATLCKVQGSAFRKPGAHMLITRTLPGTGAISGGCLEADAFERAKRVMATGSPITVTYDATRDDDKIWALNLGCKGVSDVLVEALGPQTDAARHLDFLEESLLQRETRAVALAFRVPETGQVPLGARVMLSRDGLLACDIEEPALVAALEAEARASIEAEESRAVKLTGTWGEVEFLIEVITPRISLVVCGAGYDAVPLVSMARIMGWRISLVDHRPLYADADRWADVDQIVRVRPEALTGQVLLDRHTVAVVMTHHWENDLAYLRWLLASETRYVGLLSSAARVREILVELKQTAPDLSREQLARLHGPVGLDLGRGGSEPLALAIISEIQAVLGDGAGRPLREIKGIGSMRAERP